MQSFAHELEELIAQGMKNLILDLRGNPGGYLSRAYQMADEFLESGNVIVSTEGRIPDSKQQYVATSAIGQFEEGGLVILIDYGSASASEIVSGAVQDHDRGLIVGVRSFGKGLVQLQHKFDDTSAIRVVISEYYTPSGRCIQKPHDKSSEAYAHEIEERFESGEIFDESKIKVPDSLIYYTDAGREVYGGGGIYPDVFVAPDTSGGSKYLTDLTIKNLFDSYAYSYADEHPDLISRYPQPTDFIQNFSISSRILADFQAYAADHGVPGDSKGMQRSREIISNRIKALIGRKLYQDDGFYPVIHQLDNVLQRAHALIPAARELDRTGKFQLNN
jgi:carboxyl-terminal processing protease